jgi:hypothetical protein
MKADRSVIEAWSTGEREADDGGSQRDEGRNLGVTAHGGETERVQLEGRTQPNLALPKREHLEPQTGLDAPAFQTATITDGHRQRNPQAHLCALGSRRHKERSGDQDNSRNVSPLIRRT